MRSGRMSVDMAVLALAFEVLAAAQGSHDLVISMCKGQ